MCSQRAGFCQGLGSTAVLPGMAPAGSPCPRTLIDQRAAAQGRENASLKLPQAPPVSSCACIPGCVGLCAPGRPHGDHRIPESLLALSRALGDTTICILQAPLSPCLSQTTAFYGKNHLLLPRISGSCTHHFSWHIQNRSLFLFIGKLEIIDQETELENKRLEIKISMS